MTFDLYFPREVRVLLADVTLIEAVQAAGGDVDRAPRDAVEVRSASEDWRIALAQPGKETLGGHGESSACRRFHHHRAIPRSGYQPGAFARPMLCIFQ